MKLKLPVPPVAPLLCILPLLAWSPATGSASKPSDLAGEWKVVTTRAQVGLCEIGTIDGLDKRSGRVLRQVGRARLEPSDDGSWTIRRLRPDGTDFEEPARRWTAELFPDGSVVSSEPSQAVCSDDPPRQYELLLRGKLKRRKRGVRIELRGIAATCPEMGCTFKVTYVFTRDQE